MSFRFNKYCLAVKNNNSGITAVILGTDKYLKIDDMPSIEKFRSYYESNVSLPIEDEMVKTLYDNGFVVDSDVNEYEIAKQKIEDYLKEEEKHLFLTLYVTNQCNFRCIYCPEEHDIKRFSLSKWQALYKYITLSIESGTYNNIRISFFGGEPLLETENIIHFLNDLNKFCTKYPNIVLNHQITTNGYLLTPNVYEQLKNLNVKHFQITVDGFAKTHDLMRPMVNRKSSWNTIINNLKYINSVNDDTSISLRANYNHMNLNTLKEYRDWELKTFTNKKFKFLFHPVTDFSTNVDLKLTADNLQGEDKNYIDEVNNFDKNKKSYSITPYMEFLGLRCKSSKSNFYTLSADGNISKCENITIPYEEAFIGCLSDDGQFIFNDKKRQWYENFEIENCKDCLVYPLCAGRACPAKKVLYPDRTNDCLQHFNETYTNLIDFIKNM